MFSKFPETALSTFGTNSDWNANYRDFCYDKDYNLNAKTSNPISDLTNQRLSSSTMTTTTAAAAATTTSETHSAFLQGYPFTCTNLYANHDVQQQALPYPTLFQEDLASRTPEYNNGYESPSSTWSSSSSAAASPSSDYESTYWKIEDFSGSCTPANNESFLCTAPTLEEMDYNAAVVFLSQLAEQVHKHNNNNNNNNNNATSIEGTKSSGFNLEVPSKHYYLPTRTSTPSSISRAQEENYDAQLKELMQNITPSKVLYDPKNEQLDPCVPPPRRRSSAAQAAAAMNPPRPPNAFILYRRHQQAHLRSMKPGIHLRVASKLIAIWWKAENDNVKAHYRKVAQEEKAEHMKKYPEYRYKPRLDGRKRKEAPAIMGLVSRRGRSPQESPAVSPSPLKMSPMVETPSYMRLDMFDSFLQMPEEDSL